MAIQKVILMITGILYFCLTIKGISKQNKYTQTSHYFLDTNIIKLISITDAAEYVMRFCDGEVTKAEIKFKKDIPIWKVDLLTKDRGSVKFEISAFDKSLIRIDAPEGPFSYEIIPDNGMISFSVAQKKAEDHTGLKTLKWNLFKNKKNWEYNFWLFIKSGKAQVRVNAETGEIITTKKKK